MAAAAAAAAAAAVAAAAAAMGGQGDGKTLPTPAGATYPAEVWKGPQKPQRRDRPHLGDLRSP